MSCDKVISSMPGIFAHPENACNELELKNGCNCAGCECNGAVTTTTATTTTTTTTTTTSTTTTEASTTTSGICDDSCMGMSCDKVISSMPGIFAHPENACNELELKNGCNC